MPFAQRVVPSVGGLAERDPGNQRKQRPMRSRTHRSAEGAAPIKHLDMASFRPAGINILTVAYARDKENFQSTLPKS
ncbi:hypothetical protein GW17_00056916 [Ensete ventricosum]|nr:hypothetical protein GW17_00056916 [Ensete ventricosum]